MVELHIQKTGKTRVENLRTFPVFVYKPSDKRGKESFVLLPANDQSEMISLFNMPVEDQEKFKTFQIDTENKLSE